MSVVTIIIFHTCIGSTFSVIMSPTNNPVHHSNAALANTVEMTLAMHTAQQVRQQAHCASVTFYSVIHFFIIQFSKVTEVFKMITASAINAFCDHNQQMCALVTDNRKRQLVAIIIICTCITFFNNLK